MISHGEGGSTSQGGWVPTPDAATFYKICISKRKNQDPWGRPSIRQCCCCLKISKLKPIPVLLIPLNL